MLSRSNSSAGERLRRAKSTSSTHTSSSGHQRTRTSIDPFVTRQQAETAALEAYQRACQPEDLYCPDYRPVPPKLQRRRSQISGRSEGSHLEDFRLGRRKSNPKKENVSKAKSAPVPSLLEKTTVVEDNGDEVSIRRRFVVPPNPTPLLTQSEHTSLPSSSRHARRCDMRHTDGSPVPRKSSAVKEQSSTLRLRTPQLAHHDAYSSKLSHLSDFGPPDNSTMTAIQVPQTDPNAVAMARDKCLQDFHQHKLRERTSFILAPLQKLRLANVTKTSGNNFDTKLPPFNFADELLPPQPFPPAPSASPIVFRKKSRNFSDSLKGRFKKVFRKASRAPSGLPAQHIEAKDFRFSTHLAPSVSETNPDEDPFLVISDQQTIATGELNNASGSTRDSADEQSTTKSRVTSWTNSTAADTLSSRHEAARVEVADEQAQLKRSDSMTTLRKVPVLFGRSLKNRLCRASRAELQSSEESAGLYSALQERLKPSKSPKQSIDVDEISLSTTTSALATLPSQQRAKSSVSNKGRTTAPTIRSVTPEPNVYRLDIPSPVAEVISPQSSPTRPVHRRNENLDPTPRSSLQRRPAMKAPTPSKEQIARRIEKSKNRWQSPLDEMSPPPPIARATEAEDNPYELRSLSRALHQPVMASDLPHHAKVGEKLPSSRYDVLSPSVYSSRTDGETSQPDSPNEKGDMMVTITGREVRSYSISPAKRERHEERPVQGSADWRRWLSSEMDGFNDAPAQHEFSLPQRVLKDLQSSDDSAVGESNMNMKKQHDQPMHTYSVAENKQRLVSQTTQDLNNKIDRSGQAFSAWVEDRQNQLSVDTRGGPDSFQRSNPGNAIDRASDVLKNMSATLNTTTSGHAAKTSQNTNGTSTARGDRQSSDSSAGRDLAKDPTNVHKPRSALDLRVNYKTSSLERPKPIAVRRKFSRTMAINILEDNTIQNISAGPYASQQPTLSNVATHSNNKENSPPSEANSLPVVSSSEWLAAGTNKKRDIRNTSTSRPGCRSRSVSRNSPARSPNTIVPSGGSSPGQRLVTNWLDGKRSKENSPAFV